MGLSKNEHGVYHVRKKVPKKLEAAVPRVLGLDRERVSWLKRTLNTKDLREANIRAKPILIEFDHIIAKAEALVADVPVRASLDRREIERIAAYHFASMLAEDEEVRREGTGSEPVYAAVGDQLAAQGLGVPAPSRTAFGLSDREMTQIAETVATTLPAAEAALARGDLSFVVDEIDELLVLFRVNLDRNSVSYRELGLAVLRENVRALRAIADRHAGEPVETPKVPEPEDASAPTGESLRAAYEGWKKAKRAAPGTITEFGRAIDLFIQLHGDLPVAQITRRHVREFREGLQFMPSRRSGRLRNARFPELIEWGRNHSAAPKIALGTVNKLLGACQTIAVWARDNGLIPDEVPWADPFANMRLEEPPSDREPWEPAELRKLFASPVYVRGDRPAGGAGEAAFWLPLLGLFTGARLGELAPLTVADVKTDEETGVTFISITDDEDVGKRLKTISSRRVVPVHHELVRTGFMRFVEARRKLDGEFARLFPLLRPGPRGGYGEAWSKWFGRYIRSIGITNRARVFHSFRHNFKDALREAGVSEDVNDALTGHAGGGVGRQYGKKDVARRFGFTVLADAVNKIGYRGLDLACLEDTRNPAA
ncbi:MAG TPA: site-specific integrase [Xanthobacteraceae bacterium]|nr:site-specific integrase [Xanthobacteraceae bacterium]